MPCFHARRVAPLLPPVSALFAADLQSATTSRPANCDVSYRCQEIIDADRGESRSLTGIALLIGVSVRPVSFLVSTLNMGLPRRLKRSRSPRQESHSTSFCWSGVGPLLRDCPRPRVGSYFFRGRFFRPLTSSYRRDDFWLFFRQTRPFRTRSTFTSCSRARTQSRARGFPPTHDFLSHEQAKEKDDGCFELRVGLLSSNTLGQEGCASQTRRSLFTNAPLRREVDIDF